MSDLLTRAEGEVYGPRAVPLTPELTVSRILPQRARRLVGAWCFFDHYRVDASTAEAALNVPPHPHMGLQTVTWLFDGSVHHRDSLGSDVQVRAGELNLMTSGFGISHMETSLAANVLHGLQLWIALPDAARAGAAAFEHHADLPLVDVGGALARVLIGALGEQRSPATAFTPLIGIDIVATRSGDVHLPLDERFEHAIVPVGGDAAIDGTPLAELNLAYLAPGKTSVDLALREGSRAFVFGGEPLDEAVLIWWNFVGRTHEEIAAARDAWQNGERFGSIPGYESARMEAPPISMRLRA